MGFLRKLKPPRQAQFERRFETLLVNLAQVDCAEFITKHILYRGSSSRGDGLEEAIYDRPCRRAPSQTMLLRSIR
jgi:hypothetical protein